MSEHPLLTLSKDLNKLKTKTEKEAFLRANPEKVVEAFTDQDPRQLSPENVMQILFSSHRCRIINSTGIVICQILQAASKAA